MADAGLFAIAGGALKGYGAGVLEQAKAKREAALREVEEARQDRRIADQQKFQHDEAAIGREATAAENEKDRNIKAQENTVGKPTDDMREYETAKSQGFEGTFMDYQVRMKEAGRSQVNVDTGVKLPAGFRWKDVNNQEAGVEPIPGGPGEQVPAELAARVGLADNFLEQLPGIREQVKTGSVTGPIDRALSGNGMGPGANTFRQIESGADALQRMLSGAGMPAAEAAEYARRYKPTYSDNASSLALKLDQLEAELKAAKKMAMRGRGGDVPANVSAPEIGAVEDGYRFKGGDAGDAKNWERIP